MFATFLPVGDLPLAGYFPHASSKLWNNCGNSWVTETFVSKVIIVEFFGQIQNFHKALRMSWLMYS